MIYLQRHNTESDYDTAMSNFKINHHHCISLTGSGTTRQVHFDGNGEYSKMYLTFEAITACVFTFTATANVSMTSLSYSTNNGTTWTDVTLASNNYVMTTPSVAAGNKICFKGFRSNTTEAVNGSGNDYIKVSSTGRFKAYGNLFTLYGYTNVDPMTNPKGNIIRDVANKFRGLFDGCTGLVDVQNLVCVPIDHKLAAYCYTFMFRNCTDLTNTPKYFYKIKDIKLRDIGGYQFYYTWYGCTSLVSAPRKINIPRSCGHTFTNAFYGCTSLKRAVDISSLLTMGQGTSGQDFNSMYRGCTSLIDGGKEINKETLLGEDCDYMFYGCTNLVKAPNFNCTTLGGSLRHVFENCTSLVVGSQLSNVTTLTNTSSPAAGYMFCNATKLVYGPVILKPETQSGINTYYEMFKQCTNLLHTPQVRALNLTNGCFHNMYVDTPNVRYIDFRFTDTPNTDESASGKPGLLYNNPMLSSTDGLFIKNPSATWTNTGSTSRPANWTEIKESRTVDEVPVIWVDQNLDLIQLSLQNLNEYQNRDWFYSFYYGNTNIDRAGDKYVYDGTIIIDNIKYYKWKNVRNSNIIILTLLKNFSNMTMRENLLNPHKIDGKIYSNGSNYVSAKGDQYIVDWNGIIPDD